MKSWSQELADFLNYGVEPTAREAEVSQASLSFLAEMEHLKPEQLAACAIELALAVFEWGFYPWTILNYMSSHEAMKLALEELREGDYTERLVRLLLPVLQRQGSAADTADALRLVCALRFNSIKRQPTLNSLLEAVTALMGVYPQVDKYVYTLIAKVVCKIPDLGKDYKNKFIQKMVSVTFSIFRGLENPEFLKKTPFLQVYMNFIQFIASTGKEAVIGGKQEGRSKTHTILLKLLICNLQLNETGNILSSKPCPFNLTKNFTTSPEFQENLKSIKGYDSSEYRTCRISFWRKNEKLTKSASFVEVEDRGQLVTLIKVHSMKLISNFIRFAPELFLEEQLKELVLPESLLAINPRTIFQSAALYPVAFRLKTLWRSRRRPTLTSKVAILTSINILKGGHLELPSIQAEKAEVVRTIRNVAGKEKDFSAVHALLDQSSHEVKALVVENIWSLVRTEFKRLNYRTQLNIEAGKRVRVWSKFQDCAVRLITIYFLELYSAESADMYRLLACMHFFPAEINMEEIMRCMAVNVIRYFVFPSIAFFHGQTDEFAAKFERFIDAVFDAGFSEYFLPYLDCYKEILITSLRESCKTFPQSASLSKVQTLVKFSLKMIVLDVPLMIEVAELVVHLGAFRLLPKSEFSEIHYLVPQILIVLGQMKETLVFREGLRDKGLEVEDCLKLSVPCVGQYYPTKDDNIRQPINLKKLFLKLDKLETILFEVLVEYCWASPLNENLEAVLVESFISFKIASIAFYSKELCYRKGFILEVAFVKLLSKLTIKKNKLDFTNFILSNPQLPFQNLKKKCWEELLLFYTDSVLSVEIVCANYNIIYGLKNAVKDATGDQVIQILVHCNQSMKTKNRKLINNCIKIFCYFLAYWESETIEKFLDMEVPNVFYDEEEHQREVTQAPTFSGEELLDSSFGRYLQHTYMRFATIQLKHLIMVADRIGHLNQATGKRIVTLIIRHLPKALVRMAALDSYRFSYLCLLLAANPEVLSHFTFTDLSITWSFLRKILDSQDQKLELTPDETLALKSIHQLLSQFIPQFEARLFMEPMSREKLQIYTEIFEQIRKVQLYLDPKNDEIKEAKTLLTEGSSSMSSPTNATTTRAQGIEDVITHLADMMAHLSSSVDPSQLSDIKEYLEEYQGRLKKVAHGTLLEQPPQTIAGS